MTAEVLQFGAEQMRALAQPDPATRIGTMTSQRWETLVEQMNEVNVIEKGSVNASECYTLEFLGTWEQ